MSAPAKIRLPDGEWTCRWVDSLCYSKDWNGDGIGVSCVVSYASPSGLIKRVYTPLNILYRTVTGNKLVAHGGAVQSSLTNPAQGRKIYKLTVAEDSLGEPSSCFFNHLDLSYEQHKQLMSYDSEFRELTSSLQLPPRFGYTNTHCLPNTAPDGSVQYFIIPGYEILRYFFLQGNRLPRELLSYFTGIAEKRQRVCQGIPELVVHPSGDPLIVTHKGERVAFLEVREGLSRAEVSCLARVAFLSGAVDCLDEVRGSLLLGSVEPGELTDKWFDYKSVRTILPQDLPFDMAVCGREFSWRGKSYVLVDQLYDTREDMPFDKISYRPIVDHRSIVVSSDTADKTDRPSRSRTRPAESFQLTADEPGNTNQPATVTDFADTVSVFGAKPEVIRLPKKSQTNQYQTVGMSDEERDLLSLLEQGIRDAGPGRGQVSGDAPVMVADTDTKVRNILSALTLLPNYTCTYLNLDDGLPFFQPGYYLNQALASVRYRVMIGLLRPSASPDQASIYIVWASSVRYALFHAAFLQPLQLSELAQYHTDIFGKDGLSELPPRDQIALCRRYNPANKSVEVLVRKIESRLGEIINNKGMRQLQ